ncbi:MAG: 2-oxo-4-hydroxy-4-carboxy-5-ureidoimidazoline decarboxylase [Gammaproteobacteria bacterium]|nr:2-oxo-4-hydroxy-4-carboxy-5-ureidoimidazoline decarboxylase [Gammaproteobacteria bacterium]
MVLLATCTPSQMSRSAFVEHFKDLYEHSPWVAEGVFDDGIPVELDQSEQLLAAFQMVMLGSNKDQQLALIRAHPDLAGKAAVRGELTEASTSEQAGAGIGECTSAEFARFTQLNDAYKIKFGFPFIKAVKGSDRHQILAAFETRIHNDADTEFTQALTEINKIASFRMADM